MASRKHLNLCIYEGISGGFTVMVVENIWESLTVSIPSVRVVLHTLDQEELLELAKRGVEEVLQAFEEPH